MSELQWGGRFSAEPDRALLRFGSSLEDDLVLAPFDVRTSLGHLVALEATGLIAPQVITELRDALARVGDEIEAGSFAAFARRGDYEDVHGAIDARVRDFAPAAGESLHTGRSRNDQVATSLALYVRDRAAVGGSICCRIARLLVERANIAFAARTIVAATTHWQPAQPILFAFWLHAAAQPFLRAADRFAYVLDDARGFAPLGSGAVAGSSLPLDRRAAAHFLGFRGPSTNALDSVGDRDLALDLGHAVVRALVAASRTSEELVIWSTPAFGYARLDDAASTGSSLMPQKRNPDPFELVRAAAASAIGTFAGALGTTTGVALSYHRDLQETKAQVLRLSERGLAALDAFARALSHLQFDEARMTARALDGYTNATDLADAVIVAGATARQAHRLVGERVGIAEREARNLDADDLSALGAALGREALDAPLDAYASVTVKRTAGSTEPSIVARAIDDAFARIESLEERLRP